MAEAFELGPQEASRLLKGDEAVLIDVREPEEYAVARIDGARLVPMQSVPAELQKLEALGDESKLLVICHHGVRSLQVVSWLRGQGVDNSYSVAGGIDRWSQEIDPAVPRY
jgi:rhodanese-related sulfurtransferase